MLKPKILTIAAVAMVLIGTASWLGWLRAPSGQAEESSSPSATATRDAVESRLLLSGEVTPAFQVEVKPEVGGKVKQIHVAAGQKVSKGDLLVTIDDTDLLNEQAGVVTEIEGARISVEKNRGNFERARSLFQEKLISKEVFSNLEADFRLAENTLEKSERRLQTVKDRLSKTRVVSPADGTILDIMVNEGQVVVGAASVNSGTTLILFADLSRLLINTHVNQLDVAGLSVGSQMRVRFAGVAEENATARIEFIAPVATIKNNIKGFEVQAVIEGVDARLKPGMSVSMDVSTARADHVVTVPVSAVFKENDGKIVYVRKGGVIEKRHVSVGLTDMSRAEIKSGLEEGEEILLVEPTDDHPAKS